MINGVIKNKVDELEAMAGQIQDESVDLIKGIPFVNFDIHTYPGCEPLAGCKWGISKGNIRELQSDVIRLYQRWYSASSHFTKNYLDEDRNKEFKDIYKQIIKFLQPTGSMYSSKEDYIDEYINKFDIQRGILVSILDVMEVKEMSLRKLISADFVESELNEAEILFNNKYIRGAGALAGVALEKHLQTMCQLKTIPYNHKDTFDPLATKLYTNKVLDITELKKIQHLASIRNKCDHPKNITTDEVKELIDETKKFINTH